MDRPRGPAPQTNGCSDASGSRGSVRIAPQPRELRPQRAGLKNDGLGKPMRPETVHQKSDSLWYHVRTCRERSRRIRRILMHPTPLRRRCQTPRCRTERAGHRCQSALGLAVTPTVPAAMPAWRRPTRVAHSRPSRAIFARLTEIRRGSPTGSVQGTIACAAGIRRRQRSDGS